MSKSYRKIIPTILIILITAAMVGSSTYAWFSMNNKVTVTGMTAVAKVDENLSIAKDELDSTSRLPDNQFVNTLAQTVSALLEPVSTVDGKNFYYTGKQNVKGNGDAMNEVYYAYDPVDLSAFHKNYDTTEAVGYVDYVFQMKAVNAATASEIRLVKLDMTYGGELGDLPLGAETAYRVAFFCEDITSGGVSGGPGDLIAIFRPAGANNFNANKAVGLDEGVPSVKDVVYCDTQADAETKAVIKLPANATKYYKIVVRLWLEGEDETCRNDTYIRLTEKWSLDLEFRQVSAAEPAGAVTVINQNTTAAVDKPLVYLDNDILDEGKIRINGEYYYPIKDKKLYTHQLYATAITPLSLNSRIYVIPDVDKLYLQDVTNQVTLEPPTVDSAWDNAVPTVTLIDGKLTDGGISTGKVPAEFYWKNVDGTDAIGIGADTAAFTATSYGIYYCLIKSTTDYWYKTVTYKIANAEMMMATGNIRTTVYGADSYIWKEEDGTAVTGATDRTFVAPDGGTYYCEITEGGSTYRSILVSSIVVSAIDDTTGTVTLDESGKMSGGAIPDSYAWKRANGADAPGTNDEQNYVARTGGTYYCVITSGDEVYRTKNIVLIGSIVNATASGATGTVTLHAGNFSNGKTPKETDAYAWKNEDGTDADGTNDEQTYTATSSGKYYCVVTSADGKTYTSEKVTLVAP